MQIIRDESLLCFPKGLAITLGKFDGVHIGHQKLVSIVKEKAKEYGVKSAVFTFDGLPLSICPIEKQRFITLSDERANIFESLGIDVLVEYKFTEEFMHMEPEAFIDEILAHKLRAKVIVVGDDYRFGNNRRGDLEMLSVMASVYGYELIVVKKEHFDDKEISSTLVREEIKVGHMETVNMLLKRPYTVRGRVVHGNQIGRTINIPTVNITPQVNKLLPVFGVYSSEIIVDGVRYKGISNLGVKPTVSDSTNVSLESFIFDFDGDLYDKEIEVELLHFQRPEMKFENIEALTKQMNSDIEFAKTLALSVNV